MELLLCLLFLDFFTMDRRRLFECVFGMGGFNTRD
jgi:hypothetical protein